MIDQAERAKQILNDLVEYHQMPVELVKERCKAAVYELAWIWGKQHKELNHEEMMRFYRETDWYQFDLTKYQSMITPLVDLMVDMADSYGIKKVLDFGGGIGEYSIRLAKEADCDVTYLDLEGSETMKYAEWRFKKHEAKVKVVGENYEWTGDNWDGVVIMDVLEHLEKPEYERVIKALEEKARYIFCNPEDVRFNVFFPQHITKIKLEGFVQVEANLYYNKRLAKKA
jgi:2-polyprenyl-3-methyl-5-hydroxy-6-metoxy-1,4-benzoquinol methylase